METDAEYWERMFWQTPEEEAAETVAEEARLMTPGYCTEAWLRYYYERCGPTEAFKGLV